MKITAVSLYHMKIPCNGVFIHSQSRRAVSEVVLVKFRWDESLVSWGEIVPREYVTGESIEALLTEDFSELMLTLFAGQFDCVDAVVAWLGPLLEQGRSQLAFLGGLEIALLDALAQRNRLSLTALLGSPRKRPVGRCVTIGFDCETSQIRGRFIDSRLKKATAIKLKVGRDVQRDIECAAQLIQLNDGGAEIRLDGNGAWTSDVASDFLSELDSSALHSFEEPLQLNTPDLPEQLRGLHERFGVDIMADEAVCSEADALDIARARHYQWINIRVGKHGGLLAGTRIRDIARNAGMSVVGGSMVGETGVLTQVSSILLHHSNEIDYIEGLGQNRSWLEHDPVSTVEPFPTCFNKLNVNNDVFEQCLVKSRHYQS